MSASTANYWSLMIAWLWQPAEDLMVALVKVQQQNFINSLIGFWRIGLKGFSCKSQTVLSPPFFFCHSLGNAHTHTHNRTLSARCHPFSCYHGNAWLSESSPFFMPREGQQEDHTVTGPTCASVSTDLTSDGFISPCLLSVMEGTATLAASDWAPHIVPLERFYSI